MAREVPQVKPTPITYVVLSLNLGGTERLAADMAVALQGDFDVDILCLDEPGLWASQVRAKGVPVTSFYRQPGFDARLPWLVASHTRRRGSRIVHAHQVPAWFYAGLSRLWNPSPKLLLEEHGRFWPEIENRKRAVFNRWVLQPLTTRMTAVSRDVKERIARYEGLAKVRIEVIYNGTRPLPALGPEEREALRRELGFGPGDFLVGTVGRLDPIKNLPLLLKALAEARRANSGLKGVIVGDGPCASEVGRLREELGLKERVALLGYRADAARLAGAFDLFVLGSFSEGTSMALLEAMAAGVPCAVTAVGGNPEIVLDGETGWVVPSDDIASLTKAILDATDPVKRSSFGEAGRRRFQERFTFDGMMGEYRRIYYEMANCEL